MWTNQPTTMQGEVPQAAARALSAGWKRSMGAKFLLLMLLAALMSLPGLYLSGLTSDRAVQHGTSVEATNSNERTTVFGVRLADSYRSTQRSVKYITLILGLVFLTYFVLEAKAGRRVHPGQYGLVGIAQILFYLLLLSIAEIAGFDAAYALAGTATVLLFSANAQWVFGSRTLAIRALIAFSTLYLFLYVLLRLENYALLVGSVASFAAVGAIMYFTRDLDWYGLTGTPPVATAASGGVAGAPVRERWLD